jgi:hypothetical protein
MVRALSEQLNLIKLVKVFREYSNVTLVCEDGEGFKALKPERA